MQSLGQMDQGELERKRIKTLEHQVTLKLSYLIIPLIFHGYYEKISYRFMD